MELWSQIDLIHFMHFIFSYFSHDHTDTTGFFFFYERKVM